MLCVTQVFAQNRTITGTVTAKDDGLPLPGASVKVKGSNVGTQTNASGKFSISVPNGASIVVSSVGYTTQTIVVGNQSTINVTLGSSAQALGEVVVTGALGLKVQQKQLGYSTVDVGNKELTAAKVTNAATGLAGKVSGLQINLSDNGVNPNVRIVLQGNRSITGNNQALLVIDGVPIDDPSYLNTINPDDIADINILKGGVAAAIYGSKASNGVFIVTTKKGTKGRASVTVSNTYSIQSVSYMPDLQSQFGAYGGEGAYTTADGRSLNVPYENQQYGPAFDGSMQPLALSPVFGPDGVTVLRYDTLYNKYSPIAGNKKAFFNNAPSNQFSVSFDEGDDKGTFHLGVQDVNTQGVVPNDLYIRDNIRIGGTRNYGKFSVEYNASYDQSRTSTYGQSYNQTSGAFNSGDNLYFEILNIGANIPLTSFKDYNTSKYGNINSYYNAYATNPYWTVANSRQNSNNYIFLGNINLAYKILPWLTVSDRLGVTQRTLQYKYTRAQVQFAPWAIADPWAAGNVPSSLKYVFPGEEDQTYFEQRLNNDLLLTADKKIGDISIHALVGNNMQQSYQRTMTLFSSQLQFPGDYNISSGLGIPGYGENSYRQRAAAFYEEATIGFRDYLFLHATNRDEWNSVLAQSQNHYEYPSADLSFVFTEAFSTLKNNSILSYGKIRGGIARVANINLGTSANPYGAYDLINPYNTAGGFPFGSLGGYTASGLSLNELIKPELTTSKEIGLELGFLDNRIHFSFTDYHSDSRDQSLTANVSAATGFGQELVNAGLVTNDGQEIDINVIPIKTNKFQWNLGVNYTHQSNKVVALAGGAQQLSLGNNVYAVVNKPYPIIETEDFVRDPKSGKVIVDPVTGLPSVSSTLSEYGTTNPTRIFGLTNTLTYGPWSLYFVIDARGGNQIYNGIGGTLAFTGVSSQTASNGRQRFIFPNSVVLQNGQYVPNTSVAVDQGGDVESSGFWPTIFSSSLGSIFVDDASFIKLREATLTYTIPANLLASIHFIKKASISAIGRNLWMWRPKSNTFTDPEFSDAGSGNSIGSTSTNETPPTRFIGGNITITF
jgi:TonB-linked SusC/RagA family outer membrane protein